ncbi:hypothetical protein [Maribacter sp. 1_2014MBL_MicDiv]|uniref:hypothetical protein n=1 Tax=Maribacter sp. 1_2014MBL_MicDiv TaxID=1644130 RepID=UPI0008F53D76|nr:hypothetical protein [Maribacter sp. 1_2014MBL_MicDiv]APA64457.1 hypothetical protein YQ22_09075 [Maribacter sp. 1_2014MBL_MicDiv]
MKTRYSSILVILTLFFVSCEGEFIPKNNSIALIEPDGLCQGGISTTNNRLEIPFSWSIDSETGFKEFSIQLIREDDNSTSNYNVSGLKLDTIITLERGKNYQWSIIGRLNSGEEIPTNQISFYSESEPILDILPLPSQILIANRTDSFLITWNNDNEDIDNLSYKVWLSDKIESETAIEDVTQLNYTQLGATRFDTDIKEEIILKSSLSTGDYIVRIETIKTENGISNSVDTYSKLSN